MPAQYLWSYNLHKMPVKVSKTTVAPRKYDLWSLGLKLWCRVAQRCPILVRKHNAHADDIVITVDDGPNPESTPQLLQLLKDHRRKAVFFVVGERAVGRLDLIRKIVEDGHQIYAHGWDHVRLDKRGSDEIVAQMNQCESLLSKIRPTPSPYLVRLPFNAGYRKISVHRALLKWRSDCQIAHWAINPKDYLYSDLLAHAPNWRAVLRSMMKQAIAYQRVPGAIILLHDQPYGAMKGDTSAVDLTIETMESLLETMNELGLDATFL